MLNNSFIENSFKSKLKTIGQFGHALVLLETSPRVRFNKYDFEIFLPSV
jgi:hypothetical protein